MQITQNQQKSSTLGENNLPLWHPEAAFEENKNSLSSSSLYH